MRADAKLKRKQLIAAATEQFRTRASNEVTLEAIARQAGVGIATLYRHFSTRDQLRQACAIDLFDTLDEVLAETIERFDAAPRAAWEGAIWRLADYGVGVLVDALAQEDPDAVPAELVAKRAQFFSRVQELLDKAAEHGLVHPRLGPLELAAELIVATRPLPRAASRLFPDVRERMVRHLLVAWRQEAGA